MDDVVIAVVKAVVIGTAVGLVVVGALLAILV